MRSPDELSELEECIDDACRASFREVIARPWPCIEWCPLYAVAGEADSNKGGAILGLTDSERIAFFRGFDGWEGPHSQPEMFAMGQRFRQRAFDGEYAR